MLARRFRVSRKGGTGGGGWAHPHALAACCFALYLLGTEISNVDEAWLVKRKEQTLYWVLNEMLTNACLSIT